MIKDKLMRFVETIMEKETRVLNEWDTLHKGNLSALQFEPWWDKCLADLDDVGLSRNSRELFLGYLRKVGKAQAVQIRKDQRPWPDGEGGVTSRRCCTWEEAHKVCIELEALNTDNKAVQNVFATDTTQTQSKKAQKRDAKKLAKAEKRAAKLESQLAAATGSQQPPPQRRGGCWEFMEKGTCSRGRDCRFSHEKADIDEERRKQKGKGKGGDVNAFTPKGGKPKGRGRGRGKKGKGGGQGGGSPRPRKSRRISSAHPLSEARSARMAGRNASSATRGQSSTRTGS